ncbi:MAG TPA: succinate dehydrogenase assembly factor 2 [Novosphingobium sp.]|nr:succinate dehydrogenase assembly factor 2 [Novosphingobium sp.]
MPAFENDRPARLARSRFRAWHRGTREMDYIVGGFFDRHHADWSVHELEWFEALLREEDPDVLGWAMGTLAVPERYSGALMDAFQKLDYVDTSR